MATNSSPLAPPEGVRGEGMDPYPTYRDGPAERGEPRSGTGTKPTDVNLPRSRRTSGAPLFIGVIIFAVVIVIYLLMGGYNMLRTTKGAMTPGQPAAPTTASTTAPSSSAASGSSGAIGGGSSQAQSTGPSATPVTPGAVDVPGGGATAPAQTTTTQTAPAQ
jgi:hypothetical protein